MNVTAASGAAKATEAPDGQPVATQLSDGQPGVGTKTMNAVSQIGDGQVRRIMVCKYFVLNRPTSGASDLQSCPADIRRSDPTAYDSGCEPDL